jgi:hypothetical protein
VTPPSQLAAEPIDGADKRRPRSFLDGHAVSRDSVQRVEKLALFLRSVLGQLLRGNLVTAEVTEARPELRRLVFYRAIPACVATPIPALKLLRVAERINGGVDVSVICSARTNLMRPAFELLRTSCSA